VTYTPDLDAYFARIGHTGPRTACARDAARPPAYAHVQTIPFENLDVLLGRRDLAPDGDRRTEARPPRRGGYCFEQNSLLLARAAGTRLRRDADLSARVRLQRPREFTPPRTHMFVRVQLDGERVAVRRRRRRAVADRTAALDVETRTGDAARTAPPDPSGRVGTSGDRRSPDARLFHQVQARHGDTWQDVCEFTLEEMPEIDREVGNWFTSAHPQSHFKNRLMAARATPTGRLTLVDRELTHRGHDGVATVTPIASHDELLAVLAREFALHFPAGTRFASPGLAELP
jgi:N-hydroxyarylamine O-acetyltransferase